MDSIKVGKIIPLFEILNEINCSSAILSEISAKNLYTEIKKDEKNLKKFSINIDYELISRQQEFILKNAKCPDEGDAFKELKKQAEKEYISFEQKCSSGDISIIAH